MIYFNVKLKRGLDNFFKIDYREEKYICIV